MSLFRKYYKNVIILLLGIILMGAGGVLFLTANIGGDALLVLNQGVGVSLNIETGYAMILTAIPLFIFVLLFYRKSIGIGTILVTFLLGLVINLFVKINIIQTSPNFIINLLILLSGIIVGGLGVALYIYANLGLSPFEGVIMYIVEKTKWRFGFVKIITDLILFLMGFLLGGTVGVGSVILIFAFGPAIDIYLTLLNKTKILQPINPKEDNNEIIIEEEV